MFARAHLNLLVCSLKVKASAYEGGMRVSRHECEANIGCHWQCRILSIHSMNSIYGSQWGIPYLGPPPFRGRWMDFVGNLDSYRSHDVRGGQGSLDQNTVGFPGNCHFQTQLFSGFFSFLFFVAAPLKWSKPQKELVPRFSRVTEQLSRGFNQGTGEPLVVLTQVSHPSLVGPRPLPLFLLVCGEGLCF